ncbi:hypothetical protein [Caballeronia sp. INML1]|uniref:DUF7946 domain-containing protein n=1 Tax=Caballeronia sp. INML1 TaxID=2921760 RepID=UPI002027C99B|nr:hypothetical protein [Caballeronia sp. INML1]
MELLTLGIRYEGGDAVHHEIDLNQLGESLQGMARLIAVAANFVVTGKTTRHFDALDVRVLAAPVQSHRCHEVMAVVEGIVASKEFWGGAVSGLIPFVIQFFLSRRDKEEMKHLADALKRQMELVSEGNQKNVDSLVGVINRLADALHPSVKKALSPVGRSVESMGLYSGERKFHEVNANDKGAMMGETRVFSDHSRQYDVVITELDMTTGACKLSIEGQQERVNGQIVDPTVTQPGNPYAEAMTAISRISILGKAEVDADGDIVKLYVLDTISPSLD